jgi:hypothetical protein
LRDGSGKAKLGVTNVIWVLVLGLIPLCSSFGSTNTVYVSALHFTVFWSASLMLVADQISASLGISCFRVWVATLLFVSAGTHIFSGHFLKPYMYQPPLWRQTVAVDIGAPPTSLKVDPDLAKFIASVRRILIAHGYRAGDDVFGFFNLPGLIFAVGAKQPGAPWYFGTWYHNDDTDGGKLRNVSAQRRQAAWVISQADVTSYRPDFLNSGIDFPNGYTKIGRETNPTTGLEIGIWKPIARH